MNAVEKTILMDNVSASKSSKRRAKNRKQSQQNQNKANNHQPNKEHETNLKVENDNGESEPIVHQKLIDFLDVRTKGRLEDHNHILTQYQDLCTKNAREDINELSRNYITVLDDCNGTNVDTGSAIKSKPKGPDTKPCNRSRNSKKGNKSPLSNGSDVGSSLQIQGNSIETNILSKNVFRPIKDNVEESSFYNENCCCSNGDVIQTNSAESSPNSNSSCSCNSGNSVVCNKNNITKKCERKKSKLKNSKAATTNTSSETLPEVNKISSQLNACKPSKVLENISNFCSTSMNGHSNDCNDSLSDVSCEGAVGYGPDTDHDYDKCAFYDATRNNGLAVSEENCDGKLKNGTFLDNSSSGDGDNAEIINKFNNNVSNGNNSASHCDPNDNVTVEKTSVEKPLEVKADEAECNVEKVEMLPEIVSPENSSLVPLSIDDCRREDGSLDPSKVIIEYKEYESELQMQDIMRLIQKELSEPYSIYTYRYFIYNWPKLCFLAAHGNEYVGAIVCKLDMHMNVKRGYIAMLAVKKEYRKMKIGTNLVQKAIEAMLADDAAEVVLETEMKNIPALRLYENLGFVRDKRLFRYYLNGVDALRLKLWFR